MIATTRTLALLLALSLAAPARAAPPLVDYVVQEGDTCEKIARKVYGSSKHLKQLHTHNKLGPLPHRLKAGTVLKVPQTADGTPARIPPADGPPADRPVADAPAADTPAAGRPIPDAPPAAPPAKPAAPDATLTFLRNEVDAFTPEQHPGQPDEPLLRGHRVNTHAASSAEITFADTSRIQLGEQSLIIILGGTSTRSRTRPEDTTLVTGSLRAHLGALAGKPRPLALQTPSAQVALEPGEAQVAVDAEQTTRLSVHRGRARLSARSRSVDVPEQHGSKAPRGKPPTPPRPLPAAPIWTTPPPTYVLQQEPAPVIAVYAAGTGLPGAPPPAGWHVQVARDERFNDLVVDTRAPLEVTRLELRVPPGRYHTRVTAIDDDQFEGGPGQAAPVTIAGVETVPAGPGQRAQLVVSPGSFCALGEGPLTEVRGPIALSPGRAHTLRCAADASGAGATTLEIPRAVAGAPLAVARQEPLQRVGDDAVALVRVSLRDAAGAPLPDLALDASADPGVQLGALAPDGEPGSFSVRVRWSPAPRPLALRFTSEGEELARVELPALRRVQAPAPAPRLRPLAAAGIGLLAAAVPLAAIGVGFTLSDPLPTRDDPLRRLDLRPAGVTALAFTPVVLASGATLLLLDRRDRRRLRVAPQTAPSSAGLLFYGRF